MLDSVECSQNVMVCPAMWMMVHLTLMGALEGIDTIEDLINCDRAELKIKKEMLQMPL